MTETLSQDKPKDFSSMSVEHLESRLRVLQIRMGQRGIFGSQLRQMEQEANLICWELEER